MIGQRNNSDAVIARVTGKDQPRYVPEYVIETITQYENIQEREPQSKDNNDANNN